MIRALEGITLATDDLFAAVTAYEALLGRRASHATGGRARFQLANTALDVIAPNEEAKGPSTGLIEMTFAVDDLGGAQTLLQRRRLPVMAQTSSPAAGLVAGPDEGRAFAMAFLARTGPASALSPLFNASEESAAVALDHLVVRTPSPDRAIALFAGRLGLDLRLDRANPDWGARLMFFRCGDLVIEAVHDLKHGPGEDADRLWGLSWRVGDIGSAHARLRARGVEVSDVRGGRRPGTQVFTVRAGCAGVPTLVIGQVRGNTMPARQGNKADRHPAGPTIDANDTLSSQSCTPSPSRSDPR
jgi:catechol 2,3-dioxygenase-like lactoylglutathione lyase family enzyme